MSARRQIAVLRMLVDEVERATRAGLDGEHLEAQVVEELARLGCTCLELASELAAEAAPVVPEARCA